MSTWFTLLDYNKVQIVQEVPYDYFDSEDEESGA